MSGYVIYGNVDSFVTQKLVCVFRCKRIPFAFEPRTAANHALLEQRAGTRSVPVVRTPDGWYLHDGRAITRLVEKLHAERPLVPKGPLQRLTCKLLAA